VRLRLGGADGKALEQCGKTWRKTDRSADTSIAAQRQVDAHGVAYAPRSSMPRETSNASFGTDHRRARSQQRWSDCVGIRAGFGASIRGINSLDTRYRTAPSFSTCFTVEKSAKQDRRESDGIGPEELQFSFL
jgi:hypothetical protein